MADLAKSGAMKEVALAVVQGWSRARLVCLELFLNSLGTVCRVPVDDAKKKAADSAAASAKAAQDHTFLAAEAQKAADAAAAAARDEVLQKAKAEADAKAA